MTPWDALRDVKLRDTPDDLTEVSDFQRYLTMYFDYAIPFGRATRRRYVLRRVMRGRFPIAARAASLGSIVGEWS